MVTCVACTLSTYNNVQSEEHINHAQHINCVQLPYDAMPHVSCIDAPHASMYLLHEHTVIV